MADLTLMLEVCRNSVYQRVHSVVGLPRPGFELGLLAHLILS
jgi:hypothetical protein